MLPEKVDSPPLDEATPYHSLIGALSHIGRFTRPDILFATFYFARFQKEPTEAHWKGAKRILRYLKGTKMLQITILKTKGEIDLQAFADADWGKREAGYKSTSGLIDMLTITFLLKSCALLSFLYDG
eukprot:Stramenopile-MAST_4_protein_5969